MSGQDKSIVMMTFPWLQCICVSVCTLKITVSTEPVLHSPLYNIHCLYIHVPILRDYILTSLGVTDRSDNIKASSSESRTRSCF